MPPKYVPRMITIHFVHYPSATPVMDCEIDANSTIGTLRLVVEDKLATLDNCNMRMFIKWHIQLQIGTIKRLRFIEINDNDEKDLLSVLTIDNNSTLHLQGPLIEGIDGIGKALALVSSQWRQSQAQQAQIMVVLQQMTLSVRQMVETQNRVQKTMDEKIKLRDDLRIQQVAEERKKNQTNKTTNKSDGAVGSSSSNIKSSSHPADEVDEDLPVETTPLHRAAILGHTIAIEALVAKGASVKIQDKYGNTPLQLFDLFGHTECSEEEKKRMRTLLTAN